MIKRNALSLQVRRAMRKEWCFVLARQSYFDSSIEKIDLSLLFVLVPQTQDRTVTTDGGRVRRSRLAGSIATGMRFTLVGSSKR